MGVTAIEVAKGRVEDLLVCRRCRIVVVVTDLEIETKRGAKAHSYIYTLMTPVRLSRTKKKYANVTLFASQSAQHSSASSHDHHLTWLGVTTPIYNS